MKKLIVIVGPNAVGKTTTAKKVVENNIYCLLSNYLSCDEMSTVVFTYSWHGERKEIYDSVMLKLRNERIEFEEYVIILKCNEAENRERAILDGRDKERVDRGMKNTFSYYDEYDYPCIDTTYMTPTEVAEKIMTLL